jgi:hypothetical protein
VPAPYDARMVRRPAHLPVVLFGTGADKNYRIMKDTSGILDSRPAS